MAFRFSRSLLIGCVPLMALSACAYDDGYGYGGVDVGTGYYSGDGYGADYYGSGYYGGWYNDYYYPGNGYYVFDRGGRRYRWNDRQRAYWEAHRSQYRDNTPGRDDWRDRDRRRDNNGRPVEGRGEYDGRPGGTPDATPGVDPRGNQGRNWRNRGGENGAPPNRNWQNRDGQGRPGTAAQPAPGQAQGQSQRYRPAESVRPAGAERVRPARQQPAPRGESRSRKQSE